MNNSEEVSLFLYRVVIAYLLAMTGFIFYISLVPERILPGSMIKNMHSLLTTLFSSAAATFLQMTDLKLIVVISGRFDIFGHSHQWWHLFTLAGFIWSASDVHSITPLLPTACVIGIELVYLCTFSFIVLQVVPLRAESVGVPAQAPVRCRGRRVRDSEAAILGNRSLCVFILVVFPSKRPHVSFQTGT